MPPAAPRDWEGIMASKLDWVEFRRKGGDRGGGANHGGNHMGGQVSQFDTTLGDNGSETKQKCFWLSTTF